MSKKNNTSGGISFFGLLGVAFIVLKLTHVIDWSWWWVMVPLWGGIALVLIVAIIAIIMASVSERRFRRKMKW